MPRKTLTTPFLNNVKPSPRGQRAEHRDTTPGLTLRVNDQGVKTWTLTYRVTGEGGISQDGRPLQGKTRRMNIGRYPNLGLRDARTRADELWSLAADGKDPAAQRHQSIMDRREAEQQTFRVITDQYIAAAERGQRVRPGKKGKVSLIYLGDRRADLENMCPAWLMNMPITDITDQDVERALDEVDAQEKTLLHPHRVDNLLKSVRCVFNFAVLRKVSGIKKSPAAEVHKRCVDESRDRALDEAEVAALWAATSDYPFGIATRIMLLTAQRRGEVGRMRWRDVDLDARVWKLPAVATKSNRANEIPLSGAVVHLLHNVPQPRREYVFSRRGHDTHVRGWSGYKRRLNKTLPDMEPWHLHDIRHTATTGLARLKVPLPVISLILNHVLGKAAGVTAVYNQHVYMDEKREGLEAWAAVVVPTTTPDDKVIKLGRPA